MRSRKSMNSGAEGSAGSSRSRSRGESSEPDSSSLWQCPTCTYRNAFSLYSCEICSTKKPSSRGRVSGSRSSVTSSAADSSLAETDHDRDSNASAASLVSSLSSAVAGVDPRSRSVSPDTMLQNATRKHPRKRRLKISDMVDLKVFTTTEITVGDKTVSICDFKLKKIVNQQCSNQSEVFNRAETDSRSVFIKEESNQSIDLESSSNSLTCSSSGVSSLV